MVVHVTMRPICDAGGTFGDGLRVRSIGRRRKGGLFLALESGRPDSWKISSTLLLGLKSQNLGKNKIKF